MRRNNRKKEVTRLIGPVLCLSILFLSVNCMSSKSGEAIKRHSTPKEQYAKKTVAVLPVMEQWESNKASTDSTIPLRNEISEKLNIKFKSGLPNATIITSNKSNIIIKENDKVKLLDEIGKTYANTGDIDNKQIAELSNLLKCEYLVFSRIKIIKGDAILAKVTGVTLEVFMIGKKEKEVVWGGAGTYKKGGILGFGGTESQSVAEELVNLTFNSF